MCYKYVLLLTYMWLCALNPGPPKGFEGPRANIKSGTHNIDCGRGLGARPQEVLHGLKCVLGASGASFCARIHIYLQVAVFVEQFQIEKYDILGPS